MAIRYTLKAFYTCRNGRFDYSNKFIMDTYYIENRSLWLDIKIIFMTVFKVLKMEGVSN